MSGSGGGGSATPGTFVPPTHELVPTLQMSQQTSAMLLDFIARTRALAKQHKLLDVQPKRLDVLEAFVQTHRTTLTAKQANAVADLMPSASALLLAPLRPPPAGAANMIYPVLTQGSASWWFVTGAFVDAQRSATINFVVILLHRPITPSSVAAASANPAACSTWKLVMSVGVAGADGSVLAFQALEPQYFFPQQASVSTQEEKDGVVAVITSVESAEARVDVVTRIVGSYSLRVQLKMLGIELNLDSVSFRRGFAPEAADRGCFPDKCAGAGSTLYWSIPDGRIDPIARNFLTLSRVTHTAEGVGGSAWLDNQSSYTSPPTSFSTRVLLSLIQGRKKAADVLPWTWLFVQDPDVGQLVFTAFLTTTSDGRVILDEQTDYKATGTLFPAVPSEPPIYGLDAHVQLSGRGGEQGLPSRATIAVTMPSGVGVAYNLQLQTPPGLLYWGGSVYNVEGACTVNTAPSTSTSAAVGPLGFLEVNQASREAYRGRYWTARQTLGLDEASAALFQPAAQPTATLASSWAIVAAIILAVLVVLVTVIAVPITVAKKRKQRRQQ